MHYVQMTRIFLFAYIYTLPFALLSVISKPVQDVLIVFIATYGFVGLELCYPSKNIMMK